MLGQIVVALHYNDGKNLILKWEKAGIENPNQVRKIFTTLCRSVLIHFVFFRFFGKDIRSFLTHKEVLWAEWLQIFCLEIFGLKIWDW